MPTELLQKIFRFALLAHGPLQSHHRQKQSPFGQTDYKASICGILLTCHHFNEIATPILYKENAIHFRDLDQSPYAWRELVGHRNADMVSSMIYGSMTLRYEWMPATLEGLRKAILQPHPKTVMTPRKIEVLDAAMLKHLRYDIIRLEEMVESFPNLAVIEIRTISKRWTPTRKQHEMIMELAKQTKLRNLKIKTYYQEPGMADTIVYDFPKSTVDDGARRFSMEEYRARA